ncbi:MAG: Flp pilus assembly complex ATPase component TadA, partial [Bdellovibrionales bacterium]|nr:Flp pilus assembly complex ATPase component TadA [Bdellovibrionales bacterium]
MTIGQSQSLAGVMSMMHQAETFEDVFEHLEPKLCAYLECERISIYVRGRADREIVAKFMSGSSGREIRVPINTNSVAGYVAMSHNSVLIADAYNDGELKAIDPKLSFNRSFDSKTGFRTKAILAVPIKFKDVFLGVLQGINCSRGEFSQEHLERANGLACTLAQKFRYELRGTRSPFDYLIMTKRLSAAVLKTIQQRAESEGASIPQLILKETGVTRAELGESFSRYYQVPFMEFDPHYTIPPELLHGINLKYLRDNRWVPIAGSVDDQVTVLVDDPTDPQKMMEIQHTLDAKSYVFHVGFADDILKFLGAGQDIGESSSNLQELVGKLQAESVEVVEDEFEDEPAEDEAVVIQLVNKIIIDSYKERASDIHIEPGKGKQNATVRIRVDGVCRASLSIPFSHVRAVVSRIKIISGLDISERRKPQDGKAVVKYKGQPLELRVATVPTVNGESIVMRILASSEPLPLEKLNFSERNLRELENIITVPHGVFLVVGPTGSGKTTTLHAILGHINTPDRKIWTAE